MRVKQAFHQLLAASAFLAVAQARWFDAGKVQDRAVVIGRQLADIIDGVGGAVSTNGTADGQNPPTKPEATATIPSTGGSSVVALPTTSLQSRPTDTVPLSTQPLSIAPTTPFVPGSIETSSSSTTQSTSSSSSWTPTTTLGAPPATPTLVVSTKIEIVTSTLGDGSKAIVTMTTKTTTTPGLSSGNGEPTGMTRKARNTVIGVVVGVGGAIVLGALGIVAWRIWGRKKHSEEDDVLMDYDLTAAASAEKPDRGGGAGGPQRTPFQSTLENYHQPNQVNPSSNF